MLNSNIRCIEMSFEAWKKAGYSMLNSNIRCIEMSDVYGITNNKFVE